MRRKGEQKGKKDSMNKFLLSTVALAGLTCTVQAATITGSLILYGNAYPEPGTIEFINNSPAAVALEPKRRGGREPFGPRRGPGLRERRAFP